MPRSTEPENSESATFGQLYAAQTKILEGGTRDEMRMFDVLLNG
jgi:hypothetical protein